MKKFVALVVPFVLLAGALAQEAATQPTLEVRLSIVENRLGRLEQDVSRLSTVPETVARIEEKLTALADRLNNNSGIIQSLGLMLAGSVLTGIVSFHRGKRSK